MKYLVTGGCGFIGSNFINLLFKEYEPEFVTNIDKITYAANINNIDPSIQDSDRYCLIQDDITTVGDRLCYAFDRHHPDIIVNFAAESHVDRSISSPGVFIKTNINGTYNLLELTRIICPNATFVQISTDEVYGSIDHGSFTEQSTIKPSSPYSASKAAADHLVAAYHKTYGLNTRITRCTNNYGPHQYHEKLIPMTIKRILNNEKVPIYGDGMNIRDWIHVDDHCRAILTAIKYGHSGEIYNVGANTELTNIDLVTVIAKELGRTFDEVAEYVTDRSGHDRRYSICADKLIGLGWKPSIDFESGMKMMINDVADIEYFKKKMRTGVEKLRAGVDI